MNTYESLQKVGSAAARTGILRLVENEINITSNKLFSAATLAITSAGSTTAKTTVDAYGVSQGALFKLAAATNMAALAGTVANGTFNVFVFSRDAYGNLLTQMGTPAATLALVRLPVWQLKRVPIGFVIVNPTGTGSFVGGTTALDDATVVPNTVYVNAVGTLDQTSLI